MTAECVEEHGERVCSSTADVSELTGGVGAAHWAQWWACSGDTRAQR